MREKTEVSRKDRDELALVLYSRMLTRRPVWVDSPAGQMVWVQMIALDESGEVVVVDHHGDDRRCEAYLLTSPGRYESSVPTATPQEETNDR